MRKRTINRVTFLNILSTILLQGISFISAPIISRLLGAENYGITSVYITWVSVVNVVCCAQTHSTIPMAKVKFADSEQEGYQSSILGLSITTFAVCSVLFLFFSKQLASMLKVHRIMLLFIAAHGFGSYCVDFLNTKYINNYDADKNVILSVSVSLAIFLCSIVLINLFPREINYWGRIIGMSSVYTVFGIGISICLLIRGKLFYHDVYWKFALSLSVPIIVHALSGQVLSQSDKVMLQQMNGPSVAGVYSLAVAFGGILLTIWGALNNAWTPFMYGYLKENQTDQIEKHGKNYLELFSVLSVGFVLLAPEVFQIFASPEYWGGVDIIPLFVVSAFFRFLYAFPAGYEFFLLKTKAVAFGTLMSGIGNIGMNYLLIPVWGVKGAALATMISNILLFLFHHVFAIHICKDLEYSFYFRKLLPYIAVVIITAASVMLHTGSWYIRWLVGAMIGCWELWRIIKRKSIF